MRNEGKEDTGLGRKQDQTETGSEGGMRKRRRRRRGRAGGQEGEQGVRRVVEECEVKRVVRGLKRAETRWVRCQG